MKFPLSVIKYEAMKTYGPLPFYTRPPGTHYMGGWLDPEVGLDLVDMMILLGIEPRFIGRLARNLLLD